MAKTKGNTLPEQKVVVNIEGEDFTLRFNELAIRLKIDPVNLADEMREQSGLYFWIARLATMSSIEAERRKQELDLYLAERQDEMRDQLEGQGKKVPGQEAMAARVKAEDEYTERLDAYLDAKQDAGLVTEAREAVRMRQYMLTAIAQGQRAEAAGVE